MKTKVTLLALAWLASGVAFAAEPAPTRAHPGMRGPDMDRMALLLDLDDYQKTEVERILKEHRQQLRAAHEAAKASGTRPSREEMKALREQNKQELETKLSGVLNETQMKKFDALREHGPRHHARGWGKQGRKGKPAAEDASG
jgi:hypothetical protein